MFAKLHCKHIHICLSMYKSDRDNTFNTLMKMCAGIENALNRTKTARVIERDREKKRL